MMDLKEKVIAAVDRLTPELIELSHKVHENPEVAMQEHKAVAWQVELLRSYGFTVTTPYCGMDTAYRAVKGTPGKGPQLGILAEYDALKGMGHACGHNIICATSCGAAIALAEVLEGQEACVYLFGAPAEEAIGGKIPMAENGAFEGLDCAMMMHPSADRDEVGGFGLACVGVAVEFFGKAAHSSRPMDGINALTSTIALFNAVNAQLHLWPNKSKINGIITAGGSASNIIPEYCACDFLLRAEHKFQILEMYDDFVRLANAAAAMTGAKVKITPELIYAERYSNHALDTAFVANMKTLGRECTWADPTAMVGSSDIGNVSLELPTIHTSLSMNAPGVVGHTPEYREAAISEGGDALISLGAKGLAMTCIDVFESPQLREAMWAEYNEKVKPYRC